MMIKKRWRWPNLRRGSPQISSLVIYIDMNFLCVEDYKRKICSMKVCQFSE